MRFHPFQTGLFTTLALLLFLAGAPLACKQKSTDQGSPPSPSDAPKVFVSEEIGDGQLGEFHVQLQVAIDGQDVGTMTVQLWPDLAPKTVRNFLSISAHGFYDGLTFHRVLREFMVQGGCENGIGSGAGPFSSLEGEFSESESRRHVYGTFSMARGPGPDTAGAQFFIICDNGPPAWSLDGQYASFGQVVDGASVLEAIASVPVDSNPAGEPSLPTKRIEIVQVRVLRKPLEQTTAIQPVERAEDMLGWPNTVDVQTLLVGVKGGILPVTRTLTEARVLAEALLARAEAGEDFDALVREFSDDPVQKGMEQPVGYRFSNDGSHPKVGQREVFDLNKDYQERFNQLGVDKRAGTLTSEQVATQARQLQVEILRLIRQKTLTPRAQRRSLADRAFELEVGELKLIPRDPARTLQGYYLMRRLR